MARVPGGLQKLLEREKALLPALVACWNMDEKRFVIYPAVPGIRGQDLRDLLTLLMTSRDTIVRGAKPGRWDWRRRCAI